MIRRRLAAYTAMYTAGISAGFFILEKQRPLIAANVIKLRYRRETPCQKMMRGFFIVIFRALTPAQT